MSSLENILGMMFNNTIIWLLLLFLTYKKASKKDLNFFLLHAQKIIKVTLNYFYQVHPSCV